MLASAVSQERKTSKHLPDSTTVRRRHDPNASWGSVVRKVGLTDQLVGNAGLVQIALDGDQALDVGHGKDDGVGAFGKVPGARFTSGVDDLPGHEARGQVGAHDDVVIEGAGGRTGPLRATLGLGNLESSRRGWAKMPVVLVCCAPRSSGLRVLSEEGAGTRSLPVGVATVVERSSCWEP
jgi:hypothetical protein